MGIPTIGYCIGRRIGLVTWNRVLKSIVASKQYGGVEQQRA